MNEEKFNSKLDFMQYKIKTYLDRKHISAQQLVKELNIDVDLLYNYLGEKRK